ncbi:hypothetical protein KAR91_71890 [Candidatus Pacearchaeota archaeon]|nr:hypothetical protein [Candidatus Pacearchaeota archaeon]
MAQIKSLDQIGSKWKRRAGNAGPEYAEGVTNPRKSWVDETAKSEKNYEQGVQNAISRKSFGKGVRKAGNQKWQDGAINKGTVRYGQGIAESGDAYTTGFAPFREVISRTALPARGPKGDPNNIQRVSVLAKALHDEKIKQQGT